MGLLERLRHGDAGNGAGQARSTLAHDARAIRATLDAMQSELGPEAPIDLRAIVRDLLDGEVPAPTRDIAMLRDEHLDPDDFYEHEIAPSWEGLDGERKAARLEGFLDLCAMVEEAGETSGIPMDMAARTRTKTLVFAWAFDETYGYLSRLARGEDA
jgi:hypothetical protein